MPPNIVMFLADQLRRDALGCYGNTVCRTPHLDRLAEQGTRSTRSGCGEQLTLSNHTFSRILEGAGYVLDYVGKWHVHQEMKARLIGWNDATGDMFQWSWVRWNFPEPVLPGEETPATVPLTSGKTGKRDEG